MKKGLLLLENPVPSGSSINCRQLQTNSGSHLTLRLKILTKNRKKYCLTEPKKKFLFHIHTEIQNPLFICISLRDCLSIFQTITVQPHQTTSGNGSNPT